MQVAATDSAKLIGAVGDCLLVLSKGDLYCTLASSHKVVGVWPYDSLRRYYCIDGMFGFVAGRRSPRGEGEFKFVTSQKEDIYHRLERAIHRAKRGSAGSPSSIEGASSKYVDSRPPAPLPSGELPIERQETPVPTSESEDEIFQSDPVKRSSIISNQSSVKRLMKEPVASDISPAYGQFNSSGASGRSGRSHASSSPWLHESVSMVPQPQESSSSSKPVTSSEVTPKRPPLPPARNSQISMVPVASEEDTYSHTVHAVPEQFQKKAMATEHNVVGDNFYNALVHRRSQESRREKASSSSRPGSEEDVKLYDVAYPEGRTVISSGDYAIARHPDVSQYNKGGAPKLPPRRMVSLVQWPPGGDMTDGGTQSIKQKRSKSHSPPPVAAAADNGETNNQDDDGLTVNPLYGSQDQLLNELALLDEEIKENLIELDNHQSSAAAVVGGEEERQLASMGVDDLPESLDFDEADQQFTTNPMYGELEEEQKRIMMERSANTNSAARSEGRSVMTAEKRTEGGGGGGTESSKEETPQPTDSSSLCESEQCMAQDSKERTGEAASEQSSSSTSTTVAAAGSDGSGIQRDAKGYSKVDKSKKANGESGEGVASNPENSETKEGDSASGAIDVPVPPLENQSSEDSSVGSPPPLPERNYSFDESELNKPPKPCWGNIS